MPHGRAKPAHIKGAVCLLRWAGGRAAAAQVIVADGGWTLVAGTLDTKNPGKAWFD